MSWLRKQEKRYRIGITYTLRGVDRVYRAPGLTLMTASEYGDFRELAKRALKAAPDSEEGRWYLYVGGLVVRGSDVSAVHYKHIRTIFDLIAWKFTR